MRKTHKPTLKEECAVKPEEPKSAEFQMKADIEIADYESELRQQFDTKYLSSLEIGPDEQSDDHPSGGTKGKGRSKKTSTPKDNKDEFLDNEDDWQKSVEYRKFSAFKKSKTNEWKRAYIASAEVYSNSNRERAKLEAQMEKLRAKQNKDVILEVCASGLHTALGSMLTKIKDAVRDAPEVAMKLRGFVRIGTNGPRVNNPLGNNNVTGLYYLLRKEYHKPSLGLFTSMLLDIMGSELSMDQFRTKPNQGLIDVQRSMYRWNKMSMWTFMSEDIFWTVVLLKRYPPQCDLREKAVMQVLNFIKEMEDKGKPYSGSMPIYNYISEWVQEVYCKSREFAVTVRKKTSPSEASSWSNVGAGVEDAAAAEARSINFKGNAAGPYTRHITRDEYLSCISVKDGKRHLYTATAKPCMACKGKDKHPSPICYSGQCRKCNLYGHREEQCCQQVEEARHADIGEVNGIEEAYSVSERMRIKFDSAASSCMSGNPQRIKSETVDNSSVIITGFNGGTSQSTATGLNSDGKREYYVSGMPKDLALLCANVYASEGVAMLFKHDGIVLKLTDEEQRDLRDYINFYFPEILLTINPPHLSHPFLPLLSFSNLSPPKE